MTPIALTVAGSDCSGGAGIQADLKTFSALQVYGCSVITCVVAENSARMARIDSLPAISVQKQMEMVLEAFPIGAIKTGMLYSTEIIERVVRLLTVSRSKAPLVVDPVINAGSGKPLLQKGAIEAMKKRLFPLARLVTPNLFETALLLGCDFGDFRTPAHLREASSELSQKYGAAFLIKGGHLHGKESIDFLCVGKKIYAYSSPKISGVDLHGTGCTLSAAITAGLAKKLSLEEAVAMGKKWITQAIRQRLKLGRHFGLNPFL
jgi:hydroxymethylpyrimidine/phosphomethylpyrimidine kinase